MGFVLFRQAHALFSAVQTWYCFLQFRLGNAFCSSDLVMLSAVQTFCSSDLVLTTCHLWLAVLLEASMLQGLIGCAHIVVV